jgi:hypothetical protein
MYAVSTKAREHDAGAFTYWSLARRLLTLPLSCGPQRKTPGIAPKACAVGRQLQWVVRRSSLPLSVVPIA